MKWIWFSEHFKFTFVAHQAVKTDRLMPKNVSKISKHWQRHLAQKDPCGEKKRKIQLNLVTTDWSKMQRYYCLHVGKSCQERSTRRLKQLELKRSGGWGTSNNGLKCCCCLQLICGLAWRAKGHKTTKRTTQQVIVPTRFSMIALVVESWNVSLWTTVLTMLCHVMSLEELLLLNFQFAMK